MPWGPVMDKGHTKLLTQYSIILAPTYFFSKVIRCLLFLAFLKMMGTHKLLCKMEIFLYLIDGLILGWESIVGPILDEMFIFSSFKCFFKNYCLAIRPIIISGTANALALLYSTLQWNERFPAYGCPYAESPIMRLVGQFNRDHM